MIDTLESGDFRVWAEATSQDAVDRLARDSFDCVLADVAAPRIDGIELLRRAQGVDADLPVILVTDNATVVSAAKAVEYGAFRYLDAAIPTEELAVVVRIAARQCRMARLRRQAFAHLQHTNPPAESRTALEARFDGALRRLWMATQPIVRWPERRVVAYEALVRSEELTLAGPEALITAAEQLGRLNDLGREIRRVVAEMVRASLRPDDFFVNLHAHDLLDETLFSPASPLSSVAERVVLEVTERASLEGIRDVRDRVTKLREVGYRIAVDDLGAGYAGLTSFVQLEPDVVKLDIELVRSVHCKPKKRLLIESMVRVCNDMDVRVVAEGVETEAERDVLDEIGCDLLQGYLFGRPARGLHDVPGCAWGVVDTEPQLGVRKTTPSAGGTCLRRVASRIERGRERTPTQARVITLAHPSVPARLGAGNGAYRTPSLPHLPSTAEGERLGRRPVPERRGRLCGECHGSADHRMRPRAEMRRARSPCPWPSTYSPGRIAPTRRPVAR